MLPHYLLEIVSRAPQFNCDLSATRNGKVPARPARRFVLPLWGPARPPEDRSCLSAGTGQPRTVIQRINATLQLRKAGGRLGRRGPLWVKMRRTQREQIRSTMPHTADIAEIRRHFAMPPHASHPQIARRANLPQVVALAISVNQKYSPLRPASSKRGA